MTHLERIGNYTLESGNERRIEYTLFRSIFNVTLFSLILFATSRVILTYLTGKYFNDSKIINIISVIITIILWYLLKFNIVISYRKNFNLIYIYITGFYLYKFFSYDKNNISADIESHLLFINILLGHVVDPRVPILSGNYFYPVLSHVIVGEVTNLFVINSPYTINVILLTIIYLLIPVEICRIGSFNGGLKKYFLISLYFLVDPLENIYIYGGMSFLFGIYLTIFYIAELPKSDYFDRRYFLMTLCCISLIFSHPISLILFLLHILSISNYRNKMFEKSSVKLIILVIIFSFFITILSLNKVIENLFKRYSQITAMQMGPSNFIDLPYRLFEAFTAYSSISSIVFILIISITLVWYRDYVNLTVLIFLLCLFLLSNVRFSNFILNLAAFLVTSPFMNEAIRIQTITEMWIIVSILGTTLSKLKVNNCL